MSSDERSWIDGTLEEAAEMLAKRATVARQLRSDLEKQSDLSEVVGDVASSPLARTALLGAGVGAVGGGLSSLFSKRKKKRTISSALTGALSGAGLGVGGHLAMKHLPRLWGEAPKGKPDGLSPAEVARNPELIGKLQELSRTSLKGDVAAAPVSFVKNYWKNHPVLGTLLAADVASQALGTAGNLSGNTSLRPGLAQEGIRRAIQQLPEGIGDNHPQLGLRNALHDATTTSFDDLQRSLVSHRRGAADIGVLNAVRDNMSPEEFDKLLRGYRTGLVRRGDLSDAGALVGKVKQLFTGESLPDDYRLAGTGWAPDGTPVASAGGAQGSKTLLGKILRGYSGGRPGVFSRYTLPLRLGSRAAVYGGIPIGMSLLSAGVEESLNQKRIDNILQQLSK